MRLYMSKAEQNRAVLNAMIGQHTATDIAERANIGLRRTLATLARLEDIHYIRSDWAARTTTSFRRRNYWRTR